MVGGLPVSNEFKTLVASITNALDAVPGLVAGPVPFDATALPNTLTQAGVHAAYTIAIQTNDTGLERQAALMRVEHIVTISLMARVKMQGQWKETLGNTLDVEQDIIAASLTVRNFPKYDVRYLGTARALTPNREYILHELSWSFEATIPTGRG